MNTTFADSQGFQQPQGQRPQQSQQPPVDPNWPAWRFHPDGRSKCCATPREASELCPDSEGWAPKPFPPPPAKLPPIAPEMVQVEIDKAVRLARAEENAKIEGQKTKARERYAALDQAYKDLDGRYGMLERERDGLLKKLADLEAAHVELLGVQADAATETEQPNIFETAAAARNAGPEEKY